MHTADIQNGTPPSSCFGDSQNGFLRVAKRRRILKNLAQNAPLLQKATRYVQHSYKQRRNGCASNS